MRKTLFVVFVYLVFVVPSLHATTHAAASCNASDVQAAIGLSVSGDTVVVQGPCTVSWGAFVDIPSSKGITVQASGTVTLTHFGFTLEANPSAESRITGFTFTDGGVVGSGHANAIQAHNDNATSVASTYRIDHNTFTSSVGSIVWIESFGVGPGLIDHNTLTSGDAAEPIHVYGPGCCSISAGWTDDITPGGPLFIFIEDNTFNETGTGSASACAPEAYYGAREVIRHNTFNFCYVDTHGHFYSGARWFEIYNNNFVTPAGLNAFTTTQLRAGSGVYFSNIWTKGAGAIGSGSFQLNQECNLTSSSNPTNCNGNWNAPPPTSSVSWPYAWQVGSGINGYKDTHNSCSGVNSAPVYIWNLDPKVPVQNQNPTNDSTAVAQNKDYFVSASQPTSMHWQEKAGDTCSTTYTYTPYQYPHPLTSSSSSSAVGAPSNLTAVVQ